MLLRRTLFRAAMAVGTPLLLLGLVYGVEVDPSTRNASQAFYYDAYQPSASVPMDWTGSYALCDAGTTSVAFRQSEIDRVNYFRAMAGVPAEVVLDETWNGQDQQAALMMSANNGINHNPPASWMCYTSGGAAAAGKSNLALGTYGTYAIDAYIRDPGSANSAASHRRWILYPPTDEMGTGDVPQMVPYKSANALWVIDDSPVSPRPATRDPFVAWPPPGYVPYQVTYPRWSFAYPSANFSAANISMTENGAAVSVALEPVTNGYGDNTLVWIPKGLSNTAGWSKPALDVKYQVTINNVMIAGMPQSFSYSVTVFDPNTTPGDYNGDHLVDAADYSVWRDSFGQTGSGLAADGNGNGMVDAADYTVWRDNLQTVTPPPMPGDYDNNDVVNEADYDVWKASFGQTGSGLAADGNGNDVVDAADYTVWRDHLQTVTPQPLPDAGTAAITVPEPDAMLLLLLTSCGFRRRRAPRIRASR